MAEIVGLAASIVQLGGAGVKLSIELHNFITSTARADKDVIDLAEDLDTTGSALDHVGSTLRARHMRALASPQAINVAAKIVRRCEIIFAEVQEIINKKRKFDKHGKEVLTLAGKLSWPLKEQKVELLRRRLDSLKLSLSLLLDVLKLAQEERQSNLASEMQQKRDTIRNLLRQREIAIQREIELEDKVKKFELDQAAAVHKAEQIISTPATSTSNPSIASQVQLRAFFDKDMATTNNPYYVPSSSGSDTTATDDEDEHLTLEELERCAQQVQRLLHCIENVQNGIVEGRVLKHHRKKRMYKSYRRFCCRFEKNLDNSCKGSSTQTVSIDDPQLSLAPYHSGEISSRRLRTSVVEYGSERVSGSSMKAAVTQKSFKDAQVTESSHYSNEMQPNGASSARVPVLRHAQRLQRTDVANPHGLTNRTRSISSRRPPEVHDRIVPDHCKTRHQEGNDLSYEQELLDDEEKVKPIAPTLRRRRPDSNAEYRRRPHQPIAHQAAKAEEYINASRGKRERPADQSYEVARTADLSQAESPRRYDTDHHGEIRLRIGNDAPVSLNEDMEGRVLSIVPVEDGMNELVISSNNRGKSAYRSERGSTWRDRERRAIMPASQLRRDAEEMAARSSRSNRTRRVEQQRSHRPRRERRQDDHDETTWPKSSKRTSQVHDSCATGSDHERDLHENDNEDAKPTARPSRTPSYSYRESTQSTRSASHQELSRSHSQTSRRPSRQTSYHTPQDGPVIQPAISRRLSVNSRQPRPTSYCGEPAYPYMPYPHAPHEHGPPLSRSAYGNMHFGHTPYTSQFPQQGYVPAAYPQAQQTQPMRLPPQTQSQPRPIYNYTSEEDDSESKSEEEYEISPRYQRRRPSVYRARPTPAPQLPSIRRPHPACQPSSNESKFLEGSHAEVPDPWDARAHNRNPALRPSSNHFKLSEGSHAEEPSGNELRGPGVADTAWSTASHRSPISPKLETLPPLPRGASSSSSSYSELDRTIEGESTPGSRVVSAPEEDPLSKEWINLIKSPLSSPNEAEERDIVDVLLEQWTIPISV